jgi:prepilin-type N-terminal cleavage/methylation domain-containing protein
MRKNGFTLIELLIVVAIIAILAAIAFKLSGGSDARKGFASESRHALHRYGS